MNIVAEEYQTVDRKTVKKIIWTNVIANIRREQAPLKGPISTRMFLILILGIFPKVHFKH